MEIIGRRRRELLLKGVVVGSKLNKDSKIKPSKPTMKLVVFPLSFGRIQLVGTVLPAADDITSTRWQHLYPRNQELLFCG